MREIFLSQLLECCDHGRTVAFCDRLLVRTVLCATAVRVHDHAGQRLDELQCGTYQQVSEAVVDGRKAEIGTRTCAVSFKYSRKICLAII